MNLNNLIDTLVALRDSGALTKDATVYVHGCGTDNAFELEEIKVTLFNNREDEELMETSIVLSDGTKE